MQKKEEKKIVTGVGVPKPALWAFRRLAESLDVQPGIIPLPAPSAASPPYPLSHVVVGRQGFLVLKWNFWPGAISHSPGSGSVRVVLGG